MTKDAIEKLDEKQRHYCEVMSSLMAMDREKNLAFRYEKDSGKLRGFLEALEIVGVISHYEMMGLYLFYFSEDRSGKEK